MRHAGFISLGVGLAVTLAAALACAQTTSAPATRKALFTIGKDTTWVTGPVKADGTIDYVAAYNAHFSAGVTRENNAAVLVLKAFGPQIFSENVRGRVLKELGLEELANEGDYFVRMAEYEIKVGWDKGQGDRALDAVLGGKADEDDAQDVGAWLEVNAKPLAALVEASQRGRYWMPGYPGKEGGGMITLLLPSLGHSREAAKALAARAILKLRKGDVAGAEADLLTVHRLGRLLGQGGTVIERLVAVSIDYLASRGDRAWLNHANVGAAEAKRMLGELQGLPAIPSMTEPVDWGERFMALDCVMAAIREGNLQGLKEVAGDEGGPPPVPEGVVEKVEWDTVLRMWNAWYDRLLAAEKLPTLAERDAAWRPMEQELEGMKAAAAQEKDPTQLVGKIMMSLLAPSLGKAFGLQRDAVTRVEVTEVGLALRMYRAEKGQWPGGLGELAPAYLPKVPGDRFDGQDLKFKVEGDEAVVWSVGKDGKDDGGDEKKDIVVRVKGKHEEPKR